MSKPLLEKNTRYLLFWLPVVLLACSVLFYLLMHLQTHHMQEEQLLLKQQNVWNTFKSKAGEINYHVTGEYDIAPGLIKPSVELNEPRDTTIYYPAKRRYLPFQILTDELTWNNKTYFVTTYVSSTEITHLIIRVFLGEALLFVLLLISIVILNRKSSNLLWRPFFSTLKRVNEFDITRNQSFPLPKETGTTEFDELNSVIRNLIDNVNTAYYNQKQFAENASHEMQTPLAIIRSKLELLINQPNLTGKSASLLSDITDATNRLSQMNKTLLLLSKIENKQFPETEAVNISQMVKRIVENLAIYYENFPEVEFKICENVIVNANHSLAEILISNIVKNAVEHNQPNGKVIVHLSTSHILVENTGYPLQTSSELLFERFRKGSHKTKTTGLGLSLVKQICALYNYSVSYRYENGWHKVEIIFN
ncbi:MAG: sensor histidine kinase [Ginsengibacter sp.]